MVLLKSNKAPRGFSHSNKYIYPSILLSRGKSFHGKDNKECHTLSGTVVELRVSLVDTGHAPGVVSRALQGDGLGP